MAGQTASLYVDMRDQYGNPASLDLAVDFSISYVLQPDRDIRLATVEMSGNADLVTPSGLKVAFRSFAVLTIAGTYDVRVRIQGVAYCLDSYATAPGLCIPDAFVDAEQALASVSLLQGSGLLDFKAGDEVLAKVVPLDRFGNPVSYLHSAQELRFSLNATMINSYNALVQNGDVVIGGRSLAYNTQDNSHELYYTLSAAGMYSIAVDMLEPRWYGEVTYLVTRRPIQLEVTPGALDVSKVSIVPKQALAGVTAEVIVEVRDASENRITQDLSSEIEALVYGPETFSTEQGTIIVVQNADKTFSLFFQTAVADSYEVTLTVKGFQTAGVTMVVAGGPPVGRTSTAAGAGLRYAEAGTATGFNILPHDAYGNRRRVPGGDFVLTFFLETGSGVAKIVTPVAASRVRMAWSVAAEAYNVTYAVDRVGTLVMYVSLGPFEQADLIQRSPFRVLVSAARTQPDTSMMRGLGLNGAVVGRTGKFLIQARDVFGNDRASGGDPFRVSAFPEVGGSGGRINITIQDMGDGTYDVAYVTTVATRYVVLVSLNGEPVGVQPFVSPLILTTVNDAGQFSIAQTFAEGRGLLEAFAGARTSYVITLVSSIGIPIIGGGVTFSVTFTCQEVQGDCPFPRLSMALATVVRTFQMSITDNVVIENGDGTYDVHYTIPTRGVYLHEIKVSSSYIKVPVGQFAWPLQLQVYSSPTSPSHSLVDSTTPLPTSLLAGEVFSFNILARDALGNPQLYALGIYEGDAFVITSTIFGLNSGSASLVQDASNGTYVATMMLPKVGSYVITVSLNDATIGTSYTAAGAVYYVTVGAGMLSATSSIVTGPGLNGAEAGRSGAVVIVSRDIEGNALGGEQFTSDRCVAALVQEDPSLAAELAFPFECAVVDQTSGIYGAAYTMTRAGLYSLRLLLDGVLVGGREYSPVTIRPGPSSEFGTGALNGALNSSVAGIDSALVVVARDAYSNNRTVGGDTVVVMLEITNTTQATLQILADVVDRRDGTYVASFMAIISGDYAVSIYVNGKLTIASPYPLSVTASITAPSKSFARGDGLRQAVAGQVATFTIVSVDQGSLRQAAAVVDPWAATIFPVGEGFGRIVGDHVQKEPDGSYTVSYIAERVLFKADASFRPYRIDVTLDGAPLAGSPFLPILIAGPPISSTSILFTSEGIRVTTGDLIDGVAGEITELLLQTRDAFNNDADVPNFGDPVDITANVSGTAGLSPAGIGTARGEILHLLVEDIGNGRYRLTYNATVAGEYELVVLINNGLIDSGVDIVFAVSPAANYPQNFVVAGNGVSGFVDVFETTTFIIQPVDQFGNYRMDDGRLASANTTTYLRVDMNILQGAVRTNNLETWVLTDVEIVALATSPDNNATLTGGVYVVQFTASRPGVLTTRVSYVEDESVVLLNAEPFSATIRETRAVNAVLYGPIVRPEGTAIVDSLTPRSSPRVYMYLRPIDAQRNPAVIADGAEEHGGFTVEAFPTSSTTVGQPMALPDGTFSAFVSSTMVGQVQVEIKFRGEHVIGSPIPLLVKSSYAQLGPAQSFALGSGLKACVAGHPATFLVQMATDLGELFTLSKDRPCTCAQCAPGTTAGSQEFVQVYVDTGRLEPISGNGQVTDNCNGSYTVSYTVETTGRHSIEVSRNQPH